MKTWEKSALEEGSEYRPSSNREAGKKASVVRACVWGVRQWMWQVQKSWKYLQTLARLRISFFFFFQLY